MPTLHFILGGNMNETQWADLGKSISSFYKARISTPFDIVFYHYTDDVFGMIQKSQPSGEIILAGHSFGGCKAVQTAAQFAAVKRPVEHLVLFDPVEITAWNVPNTKGFTISSNVGEAICFFRGAKEAPYSGSISNSGPTFKNSPYVGDHGKCVWDGANIAMIATALAGGTFIPKPVPQPTPAKTLVGITLVWSDGTTQTLKA